MKRSSFLRCALFGIAVAPVAHAQSSVSMYGIIDAGLNYVSNEQTSRAGGGYTSHSQLSFQDGGGGGNDGSRFGLVGSEDIGGGMSAIFRLENGFSIKDGTLNQANTIFNRAAYVGLRSSQGTITLGKQYDTQVLFVQPLIAAATLGGYIGAHPGDIDNFFAKRPDNSIEYMSPNFKGFSFGGLYSLGGVPGSMGRDQIWSVGAGYQSGPLLLGAGYTNARNPNISYFGTDSTSDTGVNNIGAIGSATSPEANPVLAGYSSASTTQVGELGANYTLGKSTVGLTCSNVRFSGLGNTGASGPNPFGYSGNVAFNNAEVSYRYQFTPSFMAIAAYNFTHTTGANGRTDATYNQGEVGASYYLSKRTDVYGIVVFQHASGTDSLDQPAVAAINAQTPSTGNHQIVARVGIEQRF